MWRKDGASEPNAEPADSWHLDTYDVILYGIVLDKEEKKQGADVGPWSHFIQYNFFWKYSKGDIYSFFRGYLWHIRRK